MCGTNLSPFERKRSWVHQIGEPKKTARELESIKRVSIQKISGNEVHYTISQTSLVKIMLCSKLDSQKLLG